MMIHVPLGRSGYRGEGSGGRGRVVRSGREAPVDKRRCAWARGELEAAYHDREWGVPIHQDRLLFELLILEGAQAGLSWSTILGKRSAYRTAFDGFGATNCGAHSDAR